MDSEKVSTVQNWPKPKSVSEVHSFIGRLESFRRFINGFSGIATPVANLTRKGSGINNWNKDCDNAFSTLKHCLTTDRVLMSPDWDKTFRGHIDAMQTTIGGTLTQFYDCGRERVIAYYSKRLNSAEEKYTSNDL